MDERAIGVFDSGFGGLTIVRALLDLLPNEQLVYVGDNGRYPYGPRPAGEVQGFSAEITRYLVDRHQVKMVVVACNTASSVALESLRSHFQVPVIGVIDAGLRAAVSATRNGRVGVIGTVGTVASGAYQQAADRLRSGLDLHCAACPGFVEFVERGEVGSDQVHVLAERLLSPLRERSIDTLLLGCTHYPYLARTIADVMGREVVLVSSAEETAFDVRSVLSATGISRLGTWPPRHRFFTSGDLGTFVEVGRRLFGAELRGVEPIELDGVAPLSPPGGLALSPYAG